MCAVELFYVQWCAEQLINKSSGVCFRPWVMDTAPGDDEAPKDPGALQTHHLGYTEKDFEGK